MMLLAGAQVRRMAMSARLSVTVITSVLTRLNAATATMSVEDDEHHAFFELHGGKPGAVCCVQSRISKSPLRLRQPLRHPAGLVQVL